MQSVVVEKITWQGLRGGAIFRAITSDGKRHRIVAWPEVMPRAPIPGETWDINGVIRRHPEHGLQVEADSASLRESSGKLIINSIASSSNFPGIGKSLAQRLWDTFGEKLYDLLEVGDPEPFEEVLWPSLAKVLVQGWRESKVGIAVYRWLDRHGVPVWLSIKLIAIYGNETIEKLQENPYRLLAFVSWKQTDKVGRSLGVPADDPRRLVAAAEAAIHRRLDRAHTWTSRERLLGIIVHTLGGDADLAQKAIDLALESFALVEVGDGLQGLGPYSMEQYIASRAIEMVNGGFLPEQLTIREQPTPDRVSEILGRFDVVAGIQLNPEQRRAVWSAIVNPFSCIIGGAGVGKTTVLRAVHDVAEALCFSGVYQMALSGRASKRMSEATHRPASTIASFLCRVDAGEIDLESGEYLIIVDEASMLDLPTCYRIMRRMTPGNRLVLVGDSAQLSPIGFGLTFHALAGHPLIPTANLTEIHRAAAATGIPQASVAIRGGKIPDLREYAGRGESVCFVDATPDKAKQQIFEIVAELGGDITCQVIGAIKGGAAGINAINRHFHDSLYGKSQCLFGYAEGEPVMWTRNDYERGLLNGSMGEVVGIGDHLIVGFDGEQRELGSADANDLVHAFGVTVHKAQGSQFERVVVPVFGNRLLDRTMIYTAVTRASKQVVFVGDRQAFERAVQAPPLSAGRETGMLFQLGGLKG